MTVLFIGSEDMDVAPTVGLIRWTAADDANFGRDDGPIGINSQTGVTGYAQGRFAKQTGTVWFGFSHYANIANTNASNPMAMLADAENNAQICGLYGTGFSGQHELVYFNAAGALVRTGVFYTTPNITLTRIDIEYVRHASAGRLALYANSILVGVGFTGDTSGWGGASATGVDAFRIHGTYLNNGAFYSEFVVADEPTTMWRVATLVGTGNGDHTQFTGGFGDVDEAVLNLGDFVWSAVADERESFVMSDLSAVAQGFAVLGVYPTTWVKCGTGGPQVLRHSLRISATDYDSADIPLSRAGSRVQSAFLVNPATGAAWTPAAVNGLQSGFVSRP